MFMTFRTPFLKTIRFAVVSIFTALLCIAPATIEAQDDAVILTVDGKIDHGGDDGKARFTLAELKAIGVTTYKTSSHWTDGVMTYEGVLVRSLMEKLGARGTTVTARAIDEYFSEIPMQDFMDYDVILAFAMNGKPLSRRDKGPLWVVYPWDAHEGLKHGPKTVHAVWQLERMTIH